MRRDRYTTHQIERLLEEYHALTDTARAETEAGLGAGRGVRVIGDGLPSALVLKIDLDRAVAFLHRTSRDQWAVIAGLYLDLPPVPFELLADQLGLSEPGLRLVREAAIGAMTRWLNSSTDESISNS